MTINGTGRGSKATLTLTLALLLTSLVGQATATDLVGRMISTSPAIVADQNQAQSRPTAPSTRSIQPATWSGYISKTRTLPTFRLSKPALSTTRPISEGFHTSDITSAETSGLAGVDDAEETVVASDSSVSPPETETAEEVSTTDSALLTDSLIGGGGFEPTSTLNLASVTDKADATSITEPVNGSETDYVFDSQTEAGTAYSTEDSVSATATAEVTESGGGIGEDEASSKGLASMTSERVAAVGTEASLIKADSATLTAPLSAATNTLPPNTTATAEGDVSIASLANSIVSIAQSASGTSGSGVCAPANCLSPGGGCIVFSTLLPLCAEDEACICDLSFAAQVCTQCTASQEAVEVYATYLTACTNRGLITPTQTVEVDTTSQAVETGEPERSDSASSMAAVGTATIATAVSGIPSGSAAMSASSALDFSAYTRTGIPQGDVTLTYPSTTVSATESTSIDKSAALAHLGVANALDTGSGMTDESTLASNTALSEGRQTSAPGDIDALGATSATAPATATSSPGTGAKGVTEAVSGSSTQALDQSHEFFYESIDQSCETDCQEWLGLASSCTDDTCICSAEGVAGASKCSDCVGSASQGGNTAQLGAYSGFVSSCQSVPVPASEEGGAAGIAAMAAPSAAAGSRATATKGSSNPFLTDKAGGMKTVTAAEANDVATVTADTSGALALLPPRISAVQGGVTVLLLVVGLVSGMNVL